MMSATIAFLTTDLVFPSRIAGIAQRLGAQLVTAATYESLLGRLGNVGTVDVFILDLNSPGCDAAAIVPRLKAIANSPAAVIAYGPHVHEAKLATAARAGCDFVLTRAQFDSQADKLLTDLVNEE